MAKLFVPQAHLALLFFTIEALLQVIDFTLVLVQGVGDVFDLRSLVLKVAAVISDATLKALAFFALFELNESLLLVDRLTLLLDSFFVCRGSISGIFILLFTINSFSGCSRLLLLLLIIAFALSRSRTHLLLLHNTEGLGVGLNLALDSFDVLLVLTILHADQRENFSDFPQRVNLADILALTS